LLKIAFEIILGPKERERRYKDHDNHRHPENRIQSRERHLGENDREKQDQPSPYGRSKRVINLINKERGDKTMRTTGAKDKEKFAKKAGKTWLDPMCTPFGTK
jgi:hypothetical protein